MFFSKPIYDKIFFELAENQNYTIQTLHKAIAKKEKISLPNFYKIIDTLLENQILSKEQGKLKLHTAWILSLIELTNKVRQTYLETNDLKIDLKEGEQKIFYASSLIDLDNVRADLLSAMALKYTENESLYMYNAHLYHILGIPETETTNVKNMKQQLKKVYLLAGNESIMDQHAANILRVQGIEVICSNKTKFLKEGYFINIIGDYILESVFPTIINQYFKVLFDTIENIQDFKPEPFQNIFKMKTECKITIRRNRKDAEMFKKEIMKYFK
ncbi:MAG: hypothetical protein WC606_00075 [Candidatus Absconditabacterales bacterium]